MFVNLYLKRINVILISDDESIVKNLYEAIEAAKAEKALREQERSAVASTEEEAETALGEVSSAPQNEDGKPKLLKVEKKLEKRKTKKGLKMHSLRGELHTRITDVEIQFLLAGSVAGSEKNCLIIRVRHGCGLALGDIYYLGGLLTKAGAPTHIGRIFPRLVKNGNNYMIQLCQKQQNYQVTWKSGQHHFKNSVYYVAYAQIV